MTQSRVSAMNELGFGSFGPWPYGHTDSTATVVTLSRNISRTYSSRPMQLTGSLALAQFPPRRNVRLWLKPGGGDARHAASGASSKQCVWQSTMKSGAASKERAACSHIVGSTTESRAKQYCPG